MINNTNKNPYSILGVEENCNIETVKKKFKQLVIIYHPDKLKHHINKNKTDINGKIHKDGDRTKYNESLDFVTIVWAYEQILKNIEYNKKSKKYENALSIKKNNLEYVKEQDLYVYYCRCSDLFLFNGDLYYEYYVIYECQSCSSSVYLIP
ncbi:DnaJ protein, putative [Hepatocystis sp. ex Piliocolobus tephrosceles]|nr:DnaJ protein, putative [Hepatocystis sp. ex Piliocolobus tephrosceles]